MLVRVLGSAAGGGFPQWNCACVNCALVRAGDARVRARTQDSIAFSAGGGAWNLVNASPDIRAQIEASAAGRGVGRELFAHARVENLQVKFHAGRM